MHTTRKGVGKYERRQQRKMGHPKRKRKESESNHPNRGSTKGNPSSKKSAYQDVKGSRQAAIHIEAKN
jgi:hypothetical protein